MRNSVKIYKEDNPLEYIEMSTDDAEILAIKQLFKPLNSEYTVFVYEKFHLKQTWKKYLVMKRIQIINQNI